jgi:hypothetical protein
VTCQNTERRPASEGTHNLLRAKGATSQDTNKKASERGALTLCQTQGEGQVRILKKLPERALTSWAEGGMSGGIKGKPANEGHSLTIESRGRDK